MNEAPVSIGPHLLPGWLGLPLGARALVMFAHGSGSSRTSPRNRQVAATLRAQGLGTLLFDLLTAAEVRRTQDGADRRCVFDIPMLARRLTEAIDWAASQHALSHLPVGLFGASTGAAAALVASALRRDRVFAVVSRGGRPDLAHAALPAVTAPTLLIVGGADPDVLDLNQQALARLRAPARLKVIAGATHLFEEPGALDQVAWLAGRWFVQHLPSQAMWPAPMARTGVTAPAAPHRGRPAALPGQGHTATSAHQGRTTAPPISDRTVAPHLQGRKAAS